MTPLKEYLASLKAIEASATPGPWTAHDNHGVRYVSNGKDGRFAKFDNRICEAATNLMLQGETKLSNMDFIAASRNALPLLIAALEEAVGALEVIATPAPDDQVPDSDDESDSAAERWSNLAISRKRAARESIVRVNAILENP